MNVVNNIQNTEQEVAEQKSRKWLLFFLVFIPCMCSFSLVIFLPRQSNRVVSVSLHSVLYADYTGEKFEQPIPKIRLKAVEDAIRDEQPPVSDIEERMTDLFAELEKPVPYTDYEPVAAIEIVQIPLPTATEKLTTTPTSTASSTLTSTTIVTFTATVEPSATDAVSSTITSTPTLTLNPTSTPTFLPVMSPSATTAVALNSGIIATPTPSSTAFIPTNTTSPSQTSIPPTSSNTPVPANVPPIASNDNTITNENMAVDISVLSNDTDIDNSIDLATVTIAGLASNGFTSVNPSTGVVNYIPNPNFNGSDSFTYTVDDVSGGTSNVATVTITVNTVNDLPVANDDSVSTNEDTAFDITVTANDTDVDNTLDLTTLTIVSGTSNGGTSVNPTTGVVTFTPNLDFIGLDSFAYTVDDVSGGTSNVATVTITVNAVNDAPVANDDSTITNEDMAVDITVTSNDTDVDDALDLTTVTVISGTSNGSTSVNPTTGVVTYTPNLNFNGSDSFTYTVDDIAGDTSNVGTVTITVNPVNDSPVAVDDNPSTNEDTAFDIIVTANDTDADDALDLTTVTVISGTSSGSTSVNPTTGVVTYDPNLDFNGTDSFTYTVDDASGATSNVGTVTITVNAVNDPPVAVDDNPSTNEDTAFDITVTANDTDVDNTLDLTTVTIVSGTSNGGTSVNPTTGVVTYTPNLNFNGSDSFTYTVDDIAGDTSNVGTVTITVNPVNDPPIANDDNSEMTEDGIIDIFVFSNDTDVDNALDLTTVTVISGTSNGSTSVNPTTGVVTYTPNVNFNGTDSFTYTIDDIAGDTSNVGTVTITVNAINDSPVAVDDNPSTNEDTAFDITVTSNDTDVDDGLDLTTVTVISGTSNGSTSVNPTTGVVTYTPNLNFNGTDSFTYTIDDIAGDTSNVGTVTITVNAINDSPVVVDDNPSTNEDTAFDITVTSNDTDVDDGLDLTTVTIISGTTNGSTSVNPTTGVVTFTPNLDFNGSDSFTYTVDDASGATSNVATVTITVNAVNDAPVANDDSAINNEDVAVDITVTSNDTDVDDALDLTTVTIVSGTSNGGTSVNPTTGVVTYDPNLDFNGTDSFTYTVDDIAGDTSNVGTVTITVNSVNDPPVAVDDNPSTNEDTAFDITVTANDTDVDDTLDLTTVTVISDTSNGGTSVNPTTGVVTYTPNLDFNGSDSFTYTVDDASGATSNVGTVTITVNAVNDPPVANDDNPSTNEDTAFDIIFTANDTDADDALDLTTVTVISGTSSGSTSVNPTTGVVTYDPNLNFNGMDSFTYTVDDASGATSNVGTVTITVNPVNDLPIANDDNPAMTEDGIIDIFVFSNDTDVDNALDLTTVTVISGTSNGSTSVNPTTGVVTYDPNLDFNGTDSFTYTVDDASGATSNVGTVTITVNPVNDPPIANDDNPAMTEDGIIDIFVFSNDTDVDNALDLTTVTVISGTSNGSTSVNPTTGVVTYDPNLDFNGTDSFTYTVDDASGATSIVGTVTITVNPVNDPPVAVDDNPSTNEDTAFDITVTANDTDVDDGLDLTTVTIISGTSNGGTTVNPTTGVVTYTPNLNFNGSDSFTYTIDDATGDTSNIGTVSISVNAVNDPPIANDDNPIMTEDEIIDIFVFSNDTDVDDGLDLTTVTIISGTSNGGTSINPTTGVVTYTPSLNFNGSDSFTYTVDDASVATSNVATVTITVNAINDPPTAVDDFASTYQDRSVDIDVLANDIDVDDSIDLTTVIVTSGPSNGGTSINPTTGVIMYTPNPSYYGSDSFTYTVDDISGDTSNTGTVSLATVEDTGCTAPLAVDGNLPDGFVQSVTPADESTGIILSTNTITINFNQPMLQNDASSNGNYELYQTADTNNKVDILSANYNLDTYLVTLTIDIDDEDWITGTEYELNVKDKIANICGDETVGDVLTQFTTVTGPSCSLPLAVDGTLPDGFVQSVSPADEATGILLSTDTITISYNQPMQHGGGGGRVDDSGKYDLYQTADTENKIDILSADYDLDSYVLTLTFDMSDQDWISGTEYELEIKDSIENECEDAQGADVFTQFTTVTGPGCSLPLAVDGTLPDGFVQSVSPADEATGILLSTDTITISYNQPMQNAGGGRVNDSGKYEVYQTADTGNKVDILSADYDLDTYVVTLIIDIDDEDWISGTEYELQIKDSIENECGDEQGADVLTQFTTVTGPGCGLPLAVDGTLPDGFIQSVSPADEATGILLSTNTITISYNQPMQHGGGGGRIDDSGKYDLYQTADTGNKVDILSANYDLDTYAVTLTIDIDDQDWISGTEYELEIKDSIENECGNAQGADVFTQFTTVTGSGCSLPLAVDGTLPDGFVQSVSPADDTVGILMSTNTITISFNQPMHHGGGGGRVDDTGNYELYRVLATGDKVDVLQANYDLDSYMVTLTIDTSDKDWLSGTDYELMIKDNIENECGDDQGLDVVTQFATNYLPIATDDSDTTNEDTSTIIDVLANDADVDGTLDLTSVAIIVQPTSGTTLVNPTTGAVTYTPDPGFSGIDNFSYVVSDNAGAISNMATVAITVYAVVDDTFYLHNIPSPPSGNTSSQPELALDNTSPTAVLLYNYDIDRDAFGGLLIQKGGSGMSEGDTTKVQRWVTAPFAVETVIPLSNIKLRLWSSMKDFDITKRGYVVAYFAVRNESDTEWFIVGSLDDATWNDLLPSWVMKEIDLGFGGGTIPAGYWIEVTVVVNDSSDDDMWFAYDTLLFRSRVMFE